MWPSLGFLQHVIVKCSEVSELVSVFSVTDLVQVDAEVVWRERDR